MATTNLKTPNDFLVQGLENVEPAYADFPGSMYAGLLPSSHDDRVGETMFWLFEPTVQSVKNTLVIWLNGGPGCSSFNCGVMMEHSPVTQPLRPAGYCCLTDSTPKLAYNNYTWTKATTMLYVEHPIGTGFSYGEPLPETEQEASSDLDQFLQNFFTVFDKFQGHDFYIMGESYAGMFVPSVARYIYLKNKQALEDSNPSNRFIVKLKGAALGNGWIEPKVQGPATIDYSWYHGMIDAPTRDSLHTEWKNCMNGGPKTLNPPPFHPFTVQDDCGLMWGVLKAAGNNNAYDVTTWDPNVDQVTFTSEAFCK
jgi:carboxypeptidase C (cathepsin A)